MDENDVGKIEYYLGQIEKITQAMNEDNPITVFENTDILLQTFDSTFIKTHGFEPLNKKIKQYLTNPQSNRLLRLNSRVKLEIETSIEYYDKNIGHDERLDYDKNFEKEILEVYTMTRRLLAIIISTKLNDSFEL